MKKKRRKEEVKDQVIDVATIAMKQPKQNEIRCSKKDSELLYVGPLSPHPSQLAPLAPGGLAPAVQ